MAGPRTLVELSALTDSAERLTTRSDDCTIIWHRWGSGPMLVLVHGGFGSWTHWARNISFLAQSFTVLAPDIPGLGDSDEPPQPDVAWIANALADGVRQLSPAGADVRLAGFSFGAIIASLMAAQLRERTERLVLVGGSGLGLTRNLERQPLVKWRYLETAEAVAAANRVNLERHMIADPALIDPLAVHLQVENSRRARLRSAGLSATAITRDSLKSSGLPLAGIWGSHDITCLGHLAERRDLLRTLDPRAPFVEIPGAGHWVAYEAADIFNAELMSCLAPDRRMVVSAPGAG